MNQERELTDGFGFLLKYYRKKNSLSLVKLSEKTGISPSYINRLEKNSRRAPSVPIAQKLADALNIPITELLNIPTMYSVKENIPDLCELISKSDFAIAGKKVDKKVKSIIIQILDIITHSEWNTDNRIARHLEIDQLINDLYE